jgi:hypothetical protein
MDKLLYTISIILTVVALLWTANQIFTKVAELLLP